MVAPVHVAVDQETHVPRLVHRQNLHAVLFIVALAVLIDPVAEGEHADRPVLLPVQAPELAPHHKGLVGPRRVCHGLDPLAVLDSQDDPFPGKQAAVALEHLVHAALVVHHVYSLLAPLHREVLGNLVELLRPALRSPGHHVIQLDIPHDALQILQGHGHRAHHRHVQVCPDQLGKTGLERHDAQGAVVCGVAGL